MRITLTDPEAADRPFDLEVEVDRGVTTYPYPLSRKTPEEFLADRKGWGEAQSSSSSPAGLQIAASPSATVRVSQDGEPVGETRWGDVVETGSAESADGRVRVEMIDHGRNWVRTRVLDGKTGRPVPCRIHFRSPEGVAYAPHGHHGHVNSDMDSWHIDVGGDVRMGQLSYAYTDGTCQGWLPRGRVIVDVARGFEYEPLRREVEIRPGQTELDLTLDRWVDMNGEGWYSGDSHVHFLSAQGSHLEANGEDLDVVNMLQSQWGSLFTDTQEFTGGVSSDGESLVYVSQENRQHFLGHLILWGLKEPVMPWCSDGPGEAEIGGTLEVTMSDWADQCRGQGGTVVIPHLPNPNGEPATLIATGRADAVEMLRHGPFEHQEYYLPLPQLRLPPAPGGRHRQDVERGPRGALPHLRAHPRGRALHLRQLVRQRRPGPHLPQRRPDPAAQGGRLRHRRHPAPARQRRHRRGRGSGRVGGADPHPADRAGGARGGIGRRLRRHPRPEGGGQGRGEGKLVESRRAAPGPGTRGWRTTTAGGGRSWPIPRRCT